MEDMMDPEEKENKDEPQLTIKDFPETGDKVYF
jgi:hypothetical protein